MRTEYSADFLDRVSVADAATREVVTLNENMALTDVIDWLSTRGLGTDHQGFPVLADDGTLVGVVTRAICSTPAPTRRGRCGRSYGARRWWRSKRTRCAILPDHIVHEKVGRLPVVYKTARRRAAFVGIISRSDLLDAHRGRLDAALVTEAPPIGRAWVEPDKRLEHFVESRVALVDAALHPRLPLERSLEHEVGSFAQGLSVPCGVESA